MLVRDTEDVTAIADDCICWVCFLRYTFPQGRVFVVLEDNQVIGCVAYHRHTDARCEMKRLYVKPKYRKLKVGRQLIEKILTVAKEDGYSEMVLDTIRPLESAIHLYQKYGFQEIAPYYDNPMDDVVYMGRKL